MSDTPREEQVRMDEKALDAAMKVDPMFVIGSSTSLQDARRMLIAAHVSAYLAALPPVPVAPEGAVVWTDAQVDEAVEAWFSGMDIDLRPASREDFRMRMRKALATLPTYLPPSDAPSTDAINEHMNAERIAGMLSTLDFRPAERHPSECVPMARAILTEIAAHDCYRPTPSVPPSDAPSDEDELVFCEHCHIDGEAQGVTVGAEGSRVLCACVSAKLGNAQRVNISGLIASPPPDAPRRAEVEAAKYSSGTWNNWIAPFHHCAFCGGSLNWQQSVDVFDRPLISASCACGVMYSARLSEEGLEQGRAVDAGNKLAALCAAPAAPVDLSAVEAAIDDYHDAVRDGGSIGINRTHAALLSLYRTALSGVPAKEAGETNNG